MENDNKYQVGLTMWRLRGFLPRICIYFVFTFLTSSGIHVWPQWVVVVVKVLPIASLLKFVVRHHGSISSVMRCPFSRCVFLGLCFSLLGDSLLVYQFDDELFFISGITCFALGHTFYICAFGWHPLHLYGFPKFLLYGASLYWFLWCGNLASESAPIKLCVAGYAFLICCMNWRAFSRLSYDDVVAGRWGKVMGCFGAFNFLISDSALAINKYRMSLPYENLIIMASYYIAQLGITLSIADEQDAYSTDDKRK